MKSLSKIELRMDFYSFPEVHMALREDLPSPKVLLKPKLIFEYVFQTFKLVTQMPNSVV